MREEPVISGAVLKAALVLLVAGGLGAGAYALAGGGIDVNLPDLPEIDTTTDPVTTLQDTTLQDTTIGEDPAPEKPVPEKTVVAEPPSIQDARKLNDCIAAAQNDPDKIFACLDKY